MSWTFENKIKLFLQCSKNRSKCSMKIYFFKKLLLIKRQFYGKFSHNTAVKKPAGISNLQRLFLLPANPIFLLLLTMKKSNIAPIWIIFQFLRQPLPILDASSKMFLSYCSTFPPWHFYSVLMVTVWNKLINS